MGHSSAPQMSITLKTVCNCSRAFLHYICDGALPGATGAQKKGNLALGLSPSYQKKKRKSWIPPPRRGPARRAFIDPNNDVPNGPKLMNPKKTCEILLSCQICSSYQAQMSSPLFRAAAATYRHHSHSDLPSSTLIVTIVHKANILAIVLTIFPRCCRNMSSPFAQ